MDDHGSRRISNSHWAQSTRERNLYNLLIKQGADCLAIGSGAGGSVNGYSWMVERDLNKWHQAINEGRKPLMGMTQSVDNNYQWRHQLQAGIEVSRIPLNELTHHADKLRLLLRQWHKVGLLLDDSICMRLTNKGRFWSSNILQSLQELILKLNHPERIL